MSGMIMITSCLGAAWLSWYLTRRFVLFAFERHLVDIPNERSSHCRVTPRGGGVSFAVTFVIATAILGAVHELPLSSVVALMAGTGVAAVGYVDDCRGVSIGQRLLVQLAVSAVALYLICGNLLTLFSGRTLLALGCSLAAVALYTWLINLVNFMDGIDGLAASEAICISATCCVLLLSRHGVHSLGLLFGVLACSALGFLYWNWPSAHIFMGDSGSYFLGFTIGALMLLAVVRHQLGFWVVPVLLGVFAVDATMGLLRRMLRGERWYKPHRLQAFHHAADAFGHRRVTLFVIMVNLLWLAPLAVLADLYPQYGLAFLLTAWSPIIALSYLFHSGEVLTEHAMPRWRTMILIAGWQVPHLLSTLRQIVRSLGPKSRGVVRACLTAVICAASSLLAASVDMPSPHSPMSDRLAISFGVFSAAQLAMLLSFGVHRWQWNLFSVEDLPDIIGVCLVATLAGAVVTTIVLPGELSRPSTSGLVIQTVLLFTLIVSLRLILAVLSRENRLELNSPSLRRVIIYGANAVGLEIFSHLRRLAPTYRVVGFVDPRNSLKGVPFAGGHVLGVDSEIERLVSIYNVDDVLVSSLVAHSASGKQFLQHCREISVDTQVIASIDFGLEAGAEAKSLRASAHQ